MDQIKTKVQLFLLILRVHNSDLGAMLDKNIAIRTGIIVVNLL